MGRVWSSVSGLCLMILLVALVVPGVHAVSLGVNKGVISYAQVLKGGYAEDTVFITTDNPDLQDLTANLEGDVADWFRLEPENVSYKIANNQSLSLKVIVEPPENAQTGNYTANLRLVSGLFNAAEGQISTAVKGAFNVQLRVEVTGQEFVECVTGGSVITDAEVGRDLMYQVETRNRGNVMVRPTFTLDVWNQAQTRLLQTYTVQYGNRILPTTTQDYKSALSNDLPVGQYWADIHSDPCNDSALITFDVLAPGAISDKGVLVRVDSQAWAVTDEIVPLRAVFQNTGTTTVEAKYRATIVKDSKVVGILESDPLTAGPGQLITLEDYYKPAESGQYFFNVRVVYNDKLTAEKTSILNVNSEGMGKGVKTLLGGGTAVTLIILLIVILVLLILIKRKGRRKPQQRRRH